MGPRLSRRLPSAPAREVMSVVQPPRHAVYGQYGRQVRSLPEHTVDCWVSSAVIASNPDAMLWAPTQRGPDNWDMAFQALGGGKCLILENKGTVGGYKDPYRHVIRIDTTQLVNYLLEPSAPVYYVLPVPPWRSSFSSPQIDPMAPVPAPALCRTGAHCDRLDHSAHGPFDTWTFVIEAMDLLRLAVDRMRLGWRKTIDIPGEDFRQDPFTVDLRTFLGDLQACRRGGPRYENAREARRSWAEMQRRRTDEIANLADRRSVEQETSVRAGVLMAFVPISPPRRMA